jgi:serine/threonine protein kinase
MSAPTTADEFFQVVGKSGLIDESKLRAFVEDHAGDEELQIDPRKIAAVAVRDGLLTYFQAEQFLLGKWRGFTLGRYKLLERIGIGGMGQVFLAEHMHMRKRTAVKVLPPTKATDPVALARFYREARVAASLEHENVVHTFDIDQDGPLHFLVMEYVDGTTLLEIVKRFGPLSLARAAHYIRQTAIGLEYAHRHGMIHRDIKPGNIILDRQGTAKLLDMGLARFYRDDQDNITIKYDDKNVLGTADYVAPEQTRDSRNIDIRADIYGLGGSFYFVLTGQPPFPDLSVAEKIIAHQSKKPQSIRELRPEVPPGLAKIIEKMMAKDPKERFQTPQEIVDALEAWTNETIDPPSDEEMPRLSPAAMAGPNYAAPTRIPTSKIRDADSVKPEEPVPYRSTSVPELVVPEVAQAAFECAATIPAPPPARLASPSPAAVVQQIAALLPKTTLAPPIPAPPVFPETRSFALASDPTPQNVALRPMVEEQPRSAPIAPAAAKLVPPPPPEPAEPEIPEEMEEMERFSPSKTPPRMPALELPKPPPPVLPASDLPKPPSKHGLTRTPGLPRSRTSDRPRLPTSDVPKTGWSVPVPLPPPPAAAPQRSMESWWNIRLPESKNLLPPSHPGTPVYRPPTAAPFFDLPLTEQEPSAAARLFRSLMLMVIAAVIGAGAGIAAWYQFFRPQ